MTGSKKKVYDPRPGYKTSTRTWRVDGPDDSNCYQREHWDGRLDAKVGAAPVKVRLTLKDLKEQEG